MNQMINDADMRKTARTAGFLYLVIIVLAGFAEGYVRTGLIVQSDPAVTAANIAASELLFRIGFAADLTAFMSDAALAVLLYLLLKPVNRTVSLLAAAFRLVAHPAIAGLNLLNMFAAIEIVNSSGSTEMLSLFLNLHSMGYLIAGAFFGIHCLLLGYLVAKSGYLPRLVGVLLLAAGVGYHIESLGTVLLPRYETVYIWFVAIPASIAEISFALWLLVKGVRATQETHT